ncbi:MAG TPA: hypothetical protein VGD59_01205 [Acidisarcina sp.]
MATIIIDVPNKYRCPTFVPLDAELYLHFKEDVTFCNNNQDSFEPYLPCNIFFKAGDCWGPAVPVIDSDGIDVDYSWIPGHGECPPCESKGVTEVVDSGGQTIHVGSGSGPGKIRRQVYVDVLESLPPAEKEDFLSSWPAAHQFLKIILEGTKFPFPAGARVFAESLVEAGEKAYEHLAPK